MVIKLTENRYYSGPDYNPKDVNYLLDGIWEHSRTEQEFLDNVFDSALSDTLSGDVVDYLVDYQDYDEIEAINLVKDYIYNIPVDEDSVPYDE